MNNSMEHIVLKETLEQSDYAGKVYKEILEIVGSTFANPLLEEVEEIYNQIISKYEKLSEHQILVLSKIINELNKIKLLIDPKRLKSFKHSLNEDNELILFRESESGHFNIIIYSNDEFAYSYIGNFKGNTLDFFNMENCDFESLVLKFMS